MFSIADIQTEEENDYENSEEGQDAEEEGMAYPIRVSVSVTKVRYSMHSILPVELMDE
jgi:hypothetical protein